MGMHSLHDLMGGMRPCDSQHFGMNLSNPVAPLLVGFCTQTPRDDHLAIGADGVHAGHEIAGHTGEAAFPYLGEQLIHGAA